MPSDLPPQSAISNQPFATSRSTRERDSVDGAATEGVERDLNRFNRRDDNDAKFHEHVSPVSGEATLPAASRGVRVDASEWSAKDEVTPHMKWIAVIFMFTCSFVLAASLNSTSSNPEPWNYISSYIGWTYFMAWAISFLPQIYHNFVRRSVAGQSFDFVLLNTLGFFCYTVYNSVFYANATIRREYRERNNGKDNTVALNDVVFAVWSLLCCLINTVQIAIFDRAGQRVSYVAWGVLAALSLFIFIWAVVVAATKGGDTVGRSWLNWLNFFYGLSYVKLAISLIKYLPQIYLNYRRKLTLGWRLENCLLDFFGGLLSVLQTIIDSATTDNWEGVTGNLVKFILGFASMFYDVVFFIQHYCLYAANNKAVRRGEGEVMLRGSVSTDDEEVHHQV